MAITVTMRFWVAKAPLDARAAPSSGNGLSVEWEMPDVALTQFAARRVLSGCLLLMVAEVCKCSVGVTGPSLQGRFSEGSVVCVQKTFASYKVIMFSKLVLSLIRLGTITA